MGKRTEEEIDYILKLFPGLKADDNFRITSPCDWDYNCIAWSLERNDVTQWPFPEEYDVLDGIDYWPDSIPRDEYPESFLKMYELAGYESCEGADPEHGFQKIALFVDPDGKVTHASRQLSEGSWTSKLGQLNDIQHATPYSLEGDIYGKVEYILKKKTTKI